MISEVSESTRVLIALSAPLLPAACWLFSFRRTPYAVLWFVWCIIVTIAMCSMALGAIHVTLAGELSATFIGMGALAWIPTLITESCASESGEIQKWRSSHSSSLPTLTLSSIRIRPAKSPWGANATMQNNGMVRVYVRRSGSTTAIKEIGQADPLEDQNAFMNLRAKADQVASEFNALKIE